MPTFDLDAYQRAVTPPTVVLNGQTYTGRVLSLLEFLPFDKRRAALAESSPDTNEIISFYVDYLYAIFPLQKPAKPRWPWQKVEQPYDVVPDIYNHPGFMSLMIDFFAVQSAALGFKTTTQD